MRWGGLARVGACLSHRTMHHPVTSLNAPTNNTHLAGVRQQAGVRGRQGPALHQLPAATAVCGGTQPVQPRTLPRPTHMWQGP